MRFYAQMKDPRLRTTVVGPSSRLISFQPTEVLPLNNTSAKLAGISPVFAVKGLCVSANGIITGESLAASVFQYPFLEYRVEKT